MTDLTIKDYRILPFIVICVFFGLQPAASAKGGFFFDIDANYMVSKLERASTAGSSFSLLSTAGQAIGLKTGFMMGNYFKTYLTVDSLTQSFIGPTSRTIQHPDAAPSRMNLGLSIVHKDIEMFLNMGSQDQLAFADIDATTHDVQKLTFSTASVGMALSAASKSAFSLYVDAALTAGLGSVDFNGTPISLNSSLTGTLRISFGKAVSYGLISTMNIDEYKTETDTYTSTDFYAGLFTSLMF